MIYKIENDENICKENCGTSGTVYFEKSSDNKYEICKDRCSSE